MKIADFNQSLDSSFMLFKGEPGTGKTIAAGSYPNPYFISTDGKVGSLKLYYPTKDDIEFNLFNTFWDVFEELERLQDSCFYKTVVLDSLTRTARLAMQHSIQFRPDDVQVGKGAKNKDEANLQLLGRRRGQLLLPEIADYGAESQGLWQVLYKLHAIHQRWGCNVILIAHVIPSEGLKGESRAIMTGGKKIATEIPGEFDEIYHFEARGGLVDTEGTHYLAHTQHAGKDFARTALPLDATMDFTNKNFHEIWLQQATR